ncbi:hypothetical protein CCR75_002921 [Bremia lactucae]|uniref:HTH myb-type domain-containing protein n=1 Tax=Bremia lactucae TaxID=4779 RepID=A0A976IGH1_BRELC|nr:hypothetical protein CCR75_002921 [Bremia lactucae]
MYHGVNRPDWQQPGYAVHSSTQSQTGWFPLQDSAQQPQTWNGWLHDAPITNELSPSHQIDSSASMHTTMPAPPYIWTGEPLLQPLQIRGVHSLPNYSRPLSPYDTELLDQTSTNHHQKATRPTLLRRTKQLAIGRWKIEEHHRFLQGLETYQGPAWGEIARLIGTRTSTQVRTHAQKFFTKLARLNQTVPYFEVQIQKERARLVAQGASVTPTAQNPLQQQLATVSPRKRLASTNSSPRQLIKQYKDDGVCDLSAQGASIGEVLISLNEPIVAKMVSQPLLEDNTRLLSMTPLQSFDSLPPTSPRATSDTESLPSMNKLLLGSTSAGASI